MSFIFTKHFSCFIALIPTATPSASTTQTVVTVLAVLVAVAVLAAVIIAIVVIVICQRRSKPLRYIHLQVLIITYHIKFMSFRGWDFTPPYEPHYSPPSKDFCVEMLCGAYRQLQ